MASLRASDSNEDLLCVKYFYRLLKKKDKSAVKLAKDISINAIK